MAKMKRTGSLLAWAAAVLVTVVVPHFALAQEQRPATINVFIDCPDYFCDYDFFRTELRYVNHVRDRKDADVHVLITSQETGSGGMEFTLNFIGLRAFAGREDTLRYVVSQRATEDEIRRGLVRSMAIGLVPYLARTETFDRLAVSYTAPPDTVAKKVVDPWNYWTFSINLRGYGNGEKSYKNSYLSTSASANRTTETWKIRLSASDYYSESRYEIGDDYTVVNIQRGGGAKAMVVRSINEHWSVGGRASAWWSTYDNVDLGLRVAPAFEFDIFPYSQSTQRQMTFQYALGAQKCRYHEETIFLKTAEYLFDQSLTASYVIKRPWGSVTTSLEAANYLHDVKKYHVELYGSLEVRVFKGLRLTTGGYVTFLRDQLSLPRRGASLEEVLLRQRLLETSYNYFVSFGISYTFGSVYSTIVNPRFETQGVIIRM
ncbi:MAG: hypothetical protein H5U38_14530 [Calditrichaeota bacterium]|nr:hypothetical protein [Calditrichota bacterium]